MSYLAFAVRRSLASSRRVNSPNNSVCVGCGKIASATCFNVMLPETIITAAPINVSV